MKLIINSKTNIDQFVYDCLPNYILWLFVTSVDINKLSHFDKELNLNTYKLLRFLLDSISITKLNDSTYNIRLDKNLKVNGQPVQPYLNFITYGNRSIKGYPIIYNILKYIAENIDDIYERWLDGDPLLWSSFSR